MEENQTDQIYESVLDEIRCLPDLYKDIMIDREINGMKYKDIAEKYDIKKRSIATRIRRARGKICRKMQETITDVPGIKNKRARNVKTIKGNKRN